MKKTLASLLTVPLLIGGLACGKDIAPKNDYVIDINYKKEGFHYVFNQPPLKKENKKKGFVLYLNLNDLEPKIKLFFPDVCYFVDIGDDGLVDIITYFNEVGEERKIKRKEVEIEKEKKMFEDADSILKEYKELTEFEEIYKWWKKNYREHI